MGGEGQGKIEPLPTFDVRPGESSISGLSSGAFMAVQVHLAHSARFLGAGIIAGGPYRCAESFRGAGFLAADAYTRSAMAIGMTPLIPAMAPDAGRLAALARETAHHGGIDPVRHLARQRLYIFTGSADRVVYSDVVARTRDFYLALGVPEAHIEYRGDLAAGHAIITDNPEDSPLDANRPPYINDGGFMQSHEILRHIHGPLNPPTDRLAGRLIRFDQREFFGGEPRASMSRFGYAYIPSGVLAGGPARVHIVLHGCKQGYNYVNFIRGLPDISNQPPYGNRFITTTGYNAIAESNDIIVLYPQAEGSDGGAMQNPDGCWDWWGYSSPDPRNPDYYSKRAIQIEAIQAMLARLGG
ncbi:extracellular catalytic domain type 2 short-chain-length polyhydroxyalkanoate depolymerase [Methylobacterium platani]|uniref:Poly(3-hydroxybutyrate) depolymerase n=2 Tax=Methylobacterium platani TaxID=427683 RepID=A0A179S4X3_9HYPH|nr:poly(3-hydroxybutyrate) depolymerase [Methylobacterium platani]KMO11113.1 poly (3-hydroxybutyrate) depolymerase [Methylobacterium platani JCM 14648]OAS21783.1 poly(3-hydroxybutyrate) depolymerase [Methylobacterium platani]